MLVKLSGINDAIHLISPQVLSDIRHSKLEVLQKDCLNCEEILNPLNIRGYKTRQRRPQLPISQNSEVAKRTVPLFYASANRR